MKTWSFYFCCNYGNKQLNHVLELFWVSICFTENSKKIILINKYHLISFSVVSVISSLWMRYCWCHLSSLMIKPTKWHICQAKTLISLGICPVWSESSLSAWRKLGSLATHWAQSKDSDQTGGIQSFCWFCHEAAHLRSSSLTVS